MLSSGLTLIFSMMGVLNFAHASFYMLGAYFAYQIGILTGYWIALFIAPFLVGVVAHSLKSTDSEEFINLDTYPSFYLLSV